MLESVLVRAALPNDLPALAVIYSHYVLHTTTTFETEPPDAEEFTRRWRDVCDLGLPYLVAEENSSVLGYAYASRYRPRAAYRFTVENSVYVNHASRRSGAGTLLMRELIRLCAEGGWREMIAVIGGGGENAASIAFHEQLGFRPVGVLQRVGFKFGKAVDSMLMQRSLLSGMCDSTR